MSGAHNQAHRQHPGETGKPPMAGRTWLWAAIVGWVLVCAAGGCSKPTPPEGLILTQLARPAGTDFAQDVLDERYPGGSRVVGMVGPADSLKRRILSAGLWAAGEPVLSYDAQRVVFAGKRSPEADWQIYEARPEGGAPKILTSARGGAMDPALLGDGSLLYISPVPEHGISPGAVRPSTLYVQPVGGPPRALAFSRVGISSPTVLSDGRILFVAAQPKSGGTALYTINNDGTELTAFTGQHDEPMLLRRPRELNDGRIIFLVTDSGQSRFGKAEYVSSSRPFDSRGPLLGSPAPRVSSLEPDGEGVWLVCAEWQDQAASLTGVFRVDANTGALLNPVFADPNWRTIEAMPIRRSARPMGRLSNVDFHRTTGLILCLDANNSTCPPAPDGRPAKASRIRVFSQTASGSRSCLGEVALQADGSFMAEVPADVPLGFEALDAAGQVLRREEPFVWVRPGENRACIGCHEPHNHSPHNARPLAVQVPVPQLLGTPVRQGQKRL